MTGTRVAPARATFPALGTTAVLLVTDEAALPEAERLLRDELEAVDAAYSRFRPDSEIMRLPHGRAAPVSPLLAGALRAALRAADATDGLVDPTVGQALVDLGYDRDFAKITPSGDGFTPKPAPGWWRVRMEGDSVIVPHGVLLDLGSTGKAYAADRAAAAIFEALGCGVLVSLGGDLATAGPAPGPAAPGPSGAPTKSPRGASEGGGRWLVSVGDDHQNAGPGDPVVSVRSGGLATSSVTRRAWRRGGRPVHHIVDPRTGDVPAAVWRTVTVAARSCVDANAAATAAVVRGDGAEAWLRGLALPARLVGHDGRVVAVAGWGTHG
ncbi:FAD:protein FMN transferase [Micromonospora sp. CPCC 206061]|uniref:FAD:protein FMN transferase n=1 Tax=Micromonospora sp. CPCC 206061 TaxID=3122410 RepID=UPI002FF27C35